MNLRHASVGKWGWIYRTDSDAMACVVSADNLFEQKYYTVAIWQVIITH